MSQQIEPPFAYISTPLASEVFLTAGGGVPSITNGCAASTQTEQATNHQNIVTLDFDQSSIEYAEWSVWMPAGWDGGAVTFKAMWTASGGTATQVVLWDLQGRAYADGDALDQAWGTAVEVSDALQATSEVHISALSGAVTLAGAPAGGQMVQFRAYRNASSGSDTLAADGRLLGIKVYFSA